jgi:hypothetical protein
MLFLTSVHEGIENSWMSLKYDPKFKDVQLYLVTMYAVLSMMFTIGYGDAVPISNFERVIFLVFMILE